MKVLPFTIPVAHDRTITVQEDIMPHFYAYLHRHEEVQIIWIQAGEGTLVVGNSMHAFHPNEIYLLGPNIPHIFKSDPSYFLPESEKMIHSISIFFNPKSDKLGSLFSLPELKTLQSFVQRLQNGFKIPSSAGAEIIGYIHQLQNFSAVDRLIHFLQMLKCLSNLTELKPLATDMHEQTFSDYEGMRIGAIYNYIIQNYARNLSLEEVSEHANMTPHAFCRYFKQHTRSTFISFLNEVRVNEACKMLINGTFGGISTVAFNCGFNSVTNFNRVFKSVIGTSPREYITNYHKSTDS